MHLDRHSPPPHSGARIDQVARVLGVHEQAVVARAAELGYDAYGAKGRLTSDVVEALLANVAPRKNPKDAASLVLVAYAAAKESGKDDWQEMTLPVLKNRLLLANEGFDEADWGAPNMAYFVDLLPGLLEHLTGWPHDRARLIDDSTLPTSEYATPQLDRVASQRIRRDLWEGMVDYKSGRTYVWDIRAGGARAQRVGESAPAELILPTFTSARMSELRSEFSSSLTEIDADERIRVDQWVEHESATINLPPRLRGLWNSLVKDRIAEALREFYVAAGIDVPGDLFVKPSIRSAASAETSTLASLRVLAHKYVDAMTAPELERMQVALATVVRVTGDGGG